MSDEQVSAIAGDDSSGWKNTLLLCAGIVLAGSIVLWFIFNTEPTVTRETVTRQTAILVEVTRAEEGSFRPTIVATGTVTAAQDINLRPQVAGEVVELAEAFAPGGFVEQGETLLRIDQANYQNTLRQRESELRQALAELDLEEGRRDAAARDYAQLNRTLPPENRSLVLREPQLAIAESAIASAEAALELARLDMERTAVKAPFAAHILARNVNLGSQVSAGEDLGRLVGLDTYWVETTVPVARLRWLAFPEEADGSGYGSPVQVRDRAAWPAGEYRDGSLFRLVGELEAQTRMARILVAVEDPLARSEALSGAPRMLIGSFVECRIEGEVIPDVIRLPRSTIRKDDTVWVMQDGLLDIRPVEIVFGDSDYAYIRSGLSADEAVVTTNLSTVKQGIGLRLKADSAESGAGV